MTKRTNWKKECESLKETIEADVSLINTYKTAMNTYCEQSIALEDQVKDLTSKVKDLTAQLNDEKWNYSKLYDDFVTKSKELERAKGWINNELGKGPNGENQMPFEIKEDGEATRFNPDGTRQDGVDQFTGSTD